MTLPAYAMNLSSFPEMYERWLVGPLFRPWAEVMLEQVALATEDRVLDVACGTGVVARLAKDRLGDGGRVVGVDISPGMLAVARAVAPSIDWREGNVNALPLGDSEQFDVVVCQQGLQFFPDKAAAARELRRALGPNGRLAVSTWRALDDIPIFRELHRVAEHHVGPIVDQRHAFGDAALLATLLREAGVRDVDVKTMARTIRFDDASVFVRLNTMALVGMSAASKGMAEDERGRAVDAIVNDSADVVSPYTDGARLAFEISSNVATGRN